MLAAAIEALARRVVRTTTQEKSGRSAPRTRCRRRRRSAIGERQMDVRVAEKRWMKIGERKIEDPESPPGIGVGQRASSSIATG